MIGATEMSLRTTSRISSANILSCVVSSVSQITVVVWMQGSDDAEALFVMEDGATHVVTHSSIG